MPAFAEDCATHWSFRPFQHPICIRQELTLMPGIQCCCSTANAVADRKGSASWMSTCSCSPHQWCSRSSSQLLQAVHHSRSSPAQPTARPQRQRPRQETGLQDGTLAWSACTHTMARMRRSATAACSRSTQTCLQRTSAGCKCDNQPFTLYEHQNPQDPMDLRTTQGEARRIKYMGNRNDVAACAAAPVRGRQCTRHVTATPAWRSRGG